MNAAALNTFLFNADIVDKVFEGLMCDGIKVAQLDPEHEEAERFAAAEAVRYSQMYADRDVDNPDPDTAAKDCDKNTLSPPTKSTTAATWTSL